MKKNITLLLIALTIVSSFTSKAQTMNVIAQSTIKNTTQSLVTKYGEKNKYRISKGVLQVAAFWTPKDGSPKDFETFCNDNFINDASELELVFQKISTNLEKIGRAHV